MVSVLNPLLFQPFKTTNVLEILRKLPGRKCGHNGQEIAADAEVPEKLGKLMAHVATNMETHANWAGLTQAGKKERDALMAVAREYRAIADASNRAATAMVAMKDLPPTPHDPSQLDRAGQAKWMREKIQMQLQFAQLLTQHAAASKRALVEMEGKSRK
jgi:hypothetical protein